MVSEQKNKMKMQKGAELDMSKICHRCGNKISWWDRFRGYKLQCPPCEKIVHEMVSARILATKTPAPSQAEPGPMITFSQEQSRVLDNVRSLDDSQISRSSAMPRPSANEEFFREQMRRQQMSSGGWVATAMTAGSSSWALSSQSPWALSSQSPWDQQQAWMRQQQIRGELDERGRRRTAGTRAEIMRVAGAKERGLEEYVMGFNDEDLVIVYRDENIGVVTRVERVRMQDAPRITDRDEPPVAET